MQVSLAALGRGAGADPAAAAAIQQASAINAAMREVVAIISSQHLVAGLAHAPESAAPGEVQDEVKAVLRVAIRRS